jgi:predicted metal-dependent enzyme (double-stranded beta helix superfamily)
MSVIVVDKFIEELCNIPEPEFGVENVYDFLSRTNVCPASLEHYLFFSPRCYTRNLVFKNELFELLAICWSAGQVSRIHNHYGQKCWMSVPVGSLRVQNFSTLECDETQSFCRLEKSSFFDMHPTQPAKVEMDEPIHQVLNVSDEKAVSLHVYSKPYDRCIIYSVRQNSFSEVQLFYTSMFGKLCDGVEL